MEKNEVLDYVMRTPGNTNRAVLDSLLNELINSNSGGGGMELYGPYIVKTDAARTVANGNSYTFQLISFTDEAGNEYNSPDEDATFFLVSINEYTTGVSIAGLSLVQSVEKEMNPTITLYNGSGESIEFPAGAVYIQVLSNIQLTNGR